MNEFIYIIAVLVGVLVIASLIYGYAKSFTTEAVVWEFQSGLHFRHGKLITVLEPGRYRFWGQGHDVRLFETYRKQIVVQGQEMITADKATVKATVVAVFRITDAHLYMKDSLALIEKARGEAASLRTLANASRLFDANPQLMQLRYLETLEKVSATGMGNTLVLGSAEDLMKSKS